MQPSFLFLFLVHNTDGPSSNPFPQIELLEGQPPHQPSSEGEGEEGEGRRGRQRQDIHQVVYVHLSPEKQCYYPSMINAMAFNKQVELRS